MIAGAGAARTPARRDGSSDVREASRRFDDALLGSRRAGGARADRGTAPTATTRAAPRPQRAGWPGLAAAAPPTPDAAGSPGREATASLAADAASPTVAGLRAAIRALPAAVEAARLREGAQLTLTLGGALGVDLRAGAGGVELTLRPAAALGPVAAEALPALVAALRGRGVRVRGAMVREGPAARRPDDPPARQAR